MSTAPIFLNEAAEDTPAPYVVLSSTREPARLLNGDKASDHVTFTFECFGINAAQAEAIADGVQAIIFATQDDLRLTGRTTSIDSATLLNVATLSADMWLDPSDDSHVFATNAIDLTPQPDDPVQKLILLLEASPELVEDMNVVVLNAASEGVPMPYIVVSASHEPTITLNGALAADLVTMTLQVWAVSAAAAEHIADEIEAVVAADKRYELTSRTTGSEPETGANVSIITLDCWA